MEGSVGKISARLTRQMCLLKARLFCSKLQSTVRMTPSMTPSQSSTLQSLRLLYQPRVLTRVQTLSNTTFPTIHSNMGTMTKLGSLLTEKRQRLESLERMMTYLLGQPILQSQLMHNTRTVTPYHSKFTFRLLKVFTFVTIILFRSHQRRSLSIITSWEMLRILFNFLNSWSSIVLVTMLQVVLSFILLRFLYPLTMT